MLNCHYDSSTSLCYIGADGLEFRGSCSARAHRRPGYEAIPDGEQLQQFQNIIQERFTDTLKVQ